MLEKVEWALPRRRCGCCGKVTAASVPGVRHAAAGTVSYGPRLHAAAVLLASEGNVPVERAAMVIDTLLGVPVSAGFIARANARVADDLATAGFDEAMKTALRAVLVLAPNVQKGAGRLIDLLREANRLVVAARATGQSRLDQDVIDELRARYDADVQIGELTNMSRPWTDDKNHPGLVLARRLAAKADQVWLFCANFHVPWTNNPAEQAIRLPKRHQAISGYWHTPTTLTA